MTDLLTAFGLIALAELGDKSQLLALTFAARYRWWQVLVGVAVAAVALLGVASALGGLLGGALPERAIAVGGGVLFLGFAAWTAFWPEDDDADADASSSSRPVIAAIVAAFVVAELGDKTMLGTATLATARDPFSVWMGASLGMTAASGVAIAVGRVLGRHLPARRLRALSAVAFALFGVLLLVEAATVGS